MTSTRALVCMLLTGPARRLPPLAYRIISYHITSYHVKTLPVESPLCAWTKTNQTANIDNTWLTRGAVLGVVSISGPCVHSRNDPPAHFLGVVRSRESHRLPAQQQIFKHTKLWVEYFVVECDFCFLSNPSAIIERKEKGNSAMALMNCHLPLVYPSCPQRVDSGRGRTAKSPRLGCGGGVRHRSWGRRRSA